MNRILGIILLLVFFTISSNAFSKNNNCKKSISPVVYGLLEAKTGEERYEILLKTHRVANDNGVSVDYSGLGTIDITIPKGAEGIPLGKVNNFSDVVFNVTNNNRDVYLFLYINKSDSVNVSSKSIDNGLFSDYPELCTGLKLLVIEDHNPWVEKRKGYLYGHKRRDIILINNGKARNKTIKPYANNQSLPYCKYYNVLYHEIIVSNITLNRTVESTYKTYLCGIVGTNNVKLFNVTINTHPNDLVDDVAIQINDCTNVFFENVTINGTYSKSNHSGYGISMNNIWNYYANNLYASANWGVFGNNNINTAKIENSVINRFDIHCYGKDIVFNKVNFSKLYNQFSSVFGKIVFNACSFTDFIPVLYEPSYPCLTEHKVVFKDCIFSINKTRNYLIYIGNLSSESNSRKELSLKYWPSLEVKNMVVDVSEDVDDMIIYRTDPNNTNEIIIDGLYSVNITRMQLSYSQQQKPIDLYLTNNKVKITSSSTIRLRKVNTLQKNNVENTNAGRLIINMNENEFNDTYSIKNCNVYNIIK